MASQKIIEVNPELIETVRASMIKDGPEKIHVLADFDRTLTKAFVKGKKVPSLISVLRDHNYLTPDYPAKAKALYEKYNKIEHDPTISLDEKRRAMKEWWTTHFKLLIESGLSRKDIESVVESGLIEFRTDSPELLDLLAESKIPIIILSSSGLGNDAIKLYLKRQGRLYPNIYIVGNAFEWDENRKAVKVEQPIVHTLNKDETVVRNLPFYDQVRKRTNVILLGDSIGDVGMITGFDYDNLIKVGFLNEEVNERLTEYEKLYDVLILNDGSMEYVVDLIQGVVQ